MIELRHEVGMKLAWKRGGASNFFGGGGNCYVSRRLVGRDPGVGFSMDERWISVDLRRICSADRGRSPPTKLRKRGVCLGDEIYLDKGFLA